MLVKTCFVIINMRMLIACTVVVFMKMVWTVRVVFMMIS